MFLKIMFPSRENRHSGSIFEDQFLERAFHVQVSPTLVRTGWCTAKFGHRLSYNPWTLDGIHSQEIHSCPQYPIPLL